MKTFNMVQKIVVIFYVTCTLIACKKYVTVDPPVTQLVTRSVFNNPAAATSAQLGIYTSMNSLSYLISQKTGLLSDEFKNYASGGDNFDFYTNAIPPQSFTDQWIKGYNIIYQSNAVIEGLQNTQEISSKIKQQLIGEAKFVRGFWFFYLAATYGDVPLTLTTDYSHNGSLARSPEATVFAQAVTDLRDAQNFLNSGYVDASDTTVYPIATAERVRPNKSAATALLARVYLYLNDYLDAEAQATAVINNTAMFNLETDLKTVFLKNSREAIWQLMPSPGSNTTDGQNYILLGVPTDNQISISSQLLGSFEANDLRKSNWLGTVEGTNPVATYYFPYKYRNNTSAPMTEYNMVLRLAEQYLIRAEAEANGAAGGVTAAVNDLNIVRNRAGLPNYSGVFDKASVLTAILKERQVELFSEWGHRWYDLRRTGTLNSVMTVVTPLKGGTWYADGHQGLYPIIQHELINNRKLTQNPGY